MNDAADSRPFRRPVRLRNGTAVLIREARADDKERLIAAFAGLDRHTIYTRYFSFRKGLSQTELQRLDHPDSGRYILLVATRGEGPGETIIAGGSGVVTEPAAAVRSAECAFTVEEDYQGQGLAGHLLAAIVDLARDQGIGRLEADVLAQNQPMLAVFRRCGLPMTTSLSAGVVHLVLDLGGQGPAHGAGAKA